jgi:tetratricopeptide (TPR) repeat protein
VSADRAQLSRAAREALSRGDLAAVQNIARNLLAASPLYSDGHYLSARVALAQRQLKLAVKSFQECVKLDSGRLDAVVELADLLLRMGQHGQSCAVLNAHQSNLKKTSRAAFSAAELYSRLGLHEAALPFYKTANEIQPKVESIKAGLAACATKNGELSLAIELYESLLNANPANQRNHYELSRLRKATSQAHIDVMLEQLGQFDLAEKGEDSTNHIFLHFAIAKEYEDLEEWQFSFEHYAKGAESAAAKSQAAGYEVTQDIAALEACREVFNKSWMLNDGQSAEGPKSVQISVHDKTPIFVVGLPRTGTTLVERILASHSQIGSADETFFLQAATSRMVQAQGAGVTESLADTLKAAAELPTQKIMNAYLESVDYRLSDQPFFVDKYPFNFHYLGIVSRAMPSAKIVLLERDPMDACVAMFRQPYFKYSYRLEDLADYYQAYRRLIDHWCRVIPNIYVVTYENLINDTNAQIDQLLTYIDVDIEPQCYRFFENKGASATASSVQIRENVHSRSIGKWRNWQKQLNLLNKRLQSN